MNEVPVAPVPESKPRRLGLSDWLSIISVIISLGAGIVAWLPFHLQYRDDHDVVAKVFVPPLMRLTLDNVISADVALINRGNRNEIVRDVQLIFSDTESFQSFSGPIVTTPEAILLPPGDKRIIRKLVPESAMDGKQHWIGVRVIALDSNADEHSCTWPIGVLSVATNKQGAQFAEHSNAWTTVQIISNKRLPHQRTSRPF